MMLEGRSPRFFGLTCNLLYIHLDLMVKHDTKTSFGINALGLHCHTFWDMICIQRV